MSILAHTPLSHSHSRVTHVSEVPIFLTQFQLKIKTVLHIIVLFMIFFTLLEWKSLWTNGSIIIMNMTHDTSWYRGDDKWVTRYNEAIWLAHNKQYNEAKFSLSSIINDISSPKKAEISELYGDLIFTTSGSHIDVLSMYERSLQFAPSERVSQKIEYIKKLPQAQSGSRNTEKNTTKTGSTESGSIERANKREELQKIA